MLVPVALPATGTLVVLWPGDENVELVPRVNTIVPWYPLLKYDPPLLVDQIITKLLVPTPVNKTLRNTTKYFVYFGVIIVLSKVALDELDSVMVCRNTNAGLALHVGTPAPDDVSEYPFLPVTPVS